MSGPAPSSAPLQGLDVVIPARDEAATIAAVTARIVGAGARLWVVDDASTDGTGTLAREAGAQVLRQDPCGGYDAAIAAGINAAFEAGARAVATCDADGQHRLEDLAQVAAPVLQGELDLCAGLRDRPNRPVEKLVGLFARRLLGTRDPFCGLKCYGRPLFDRWGPFPAQLHIGTLPLAWARAGGHARGFREIVCPRRVDRPRFGTWLRANWKLARAWLQVRAAYRKLSRKA